MREAPAPEGSTSRSAGVTERPSDDAPARRRSDLLFLLPPGAFLLVAIAAYRGPHVFLSGDYAIIDIGVHQAERWQRALGPYDRFGWSHPGPSYFYLLALVSRISRLRTGQLQTAGAALVTSVSMATVLVVARRCRDQVHLGVAALAVGLAALALGPPIDLDPWNPYVVVWPLILLGAITAVAPRLPFLTWLGAAALLASFIAQTDVGAAPLAGVWVLMGLLGSLWARRGGPPRSAKGRSRWAPVTGVALLVGALASWVPTLVQQASGRPGNLGSLWHFFTGAHSSVGLETGAVLAGNAAGLLLGIHGAQLPHSRVPGILLILGLGAVSALAAAWAYRTRRPEVKWAVVVALGGEVTAVAVCTRVIGLPFAYLATWAVAPAALLGIVILQGIARPLVTRTVILVGVSVLAVLIAVAGLRHHPSGSADRVGHASSVLEQALTPTETVGVGFSGPNAWIDGAGIVDELYERGFGVAVPAVWRGAFSLPGSTARQWIVVCEGAPLPPGFSRLVSYEGLVVGRGRVPPPGWNSPTT